MNHGLGIVAPQVFSSFLLCVPRVGHTCPAHCAILEDLTNGRNVESAHLFILDIQPPHAPSFLHIVKLKKFQAPKLIGHLGKFGMYILRVCCEKAHLLC